MENGMNRESCGAACCVDEVFIFLWIEHLDAHVNDPAGREVLTFLALGRLIDQILEGIIDDIEVGIEEFPLFERTDADLKVVGGKLDSFVERKNTFPFSLCLVEEGLDCCFQLGRSVLVAKPEILLSPFAPKARQLVIEFGEN